MYIYVKRKLIIVLKLKTTHRYRLIGTELVLLLLTVYRRRHIRILHFRTKEMLNNIERLLIDFHIFMGLQEFDFVQP